jgi:hypothetical protein
MNAPPWEQYSGLAERRRVYLVLQCFFDDSGKESDHTHRFVVMAGYMAGDWGGFHLAWRSLLLKHGLPYIHMKEIVGMAQQKGWTLPTLNEVLREFVVAIKQSNLVGFGVGVDMDAWRLLPKETTKRLGVAQVFCCSRVLRRVLDHLQMAAFANESIGITFDQDFEFARQRLSLFENIWKQQPIVRERVAQLSFAASRHFYPLQAADLLAWETRRQLANRAHEKPPTARWPELMAALPSGELGYAAGEFWTREWFDEELPKLFSAGQPS